MNDRDHDGARLNRTHRADKRIRILFFTVSVVALAGTVGAGMRDSWWAFAGNLAAFCVTAVCATTWRRSRLRMELTLVSMAITAVLLLIGTVVAWRSL